MPNLQCDTKDLHGVEWYRRPKSREVKLYFSFLMFGFVSLSMTFSLVPDLQLRSTTGWTQASLTMVSDQQSYSWEWITQFKCKYVEGLGDGREIEQKGRGRNRDSYPQALRHAFSLRIPAPKHKNLLYVTVEITADQLLLTLTFSQAMH